MRIYPVDPVDSFRPHLAIYGLYFWNAFKDNLNRFRFCVTSWLYFRGAGVGERVRKEYIIHYILSLFVEKNDLFISMFIIHKGYFNFSYFFLFFIYYYYFFTLNKKSEGKGKKRELDTARLEHPTALAPPFSISYMYNFISKKGLKTQFM